MRTDDGQTREVTAAFLAAGIDPKKHIVFNQSRVRQHAELAWIFNCVARMGWMNRMTQFKDKAGKDRENASLGLFAYPNLMAADILVYRATHVPVGDDQKQHLELTRDIAQKFNNDYSARIAELGVGVEMMSGEETVSGFFPLDRAADRGTGAARHEPARRHQEDVEVGPLRPVAHQPDRRCRHDLQEDPQGKDRPRRAALRSRGAEWPSGGGESRRASMRRLPKPARSRCFEDFGGRQFSDFKPALADLAVTRLAPIAAEMRRISADPAYVDAVLRDGGERAGVLAEATMKTVRTILGLLDG